MRMRASLLSVRGLIRIVFCAGLIGLFLFHPHGPVTAQEQPVQPESPPAQAPATGETDRPVPSPAQADTPPPQPAPEPEPEPKPEPEPEAEAEEEYDPLSNEACMDCHGPSILDIPPEDLVDMVAVDGEPAPPRKKPPFVMGELNLAVDMEKYQESAHGDMTCIDCHMDIEEIPHKQRLAKVDCSMCHDEAATAVDASAHGEKAGPKAPGCIGCHNPHYGQGAAADEDAWQRKYCIECHKAYGLDTVKQHEHLYAPELHMKLNCMLCHSGEEGGVHNIPPAAQYAASCEACHNKYSILSTEERISGRRLAYWVQTRFINKDVLDTYGYVMGANRIPILDLIILIVIVGTFGLPIVHGGLRIIFRRKEPVELPEEKILLHPLVERIWHWVQALCIVMLIITGAILHMPELFPGWLEWGVVVHNWFGWAAVAAFLVWLVYNLGTGRIKHYIPRKWEIPGGMITQAKFYGYGIFKHEPHPYSPSEENKFNPLQKIAYFKFQLILFPLLLISGILYMYPETFEGVIHAIGGLAVLALIHLILAGLFTAFLIAHLYLATTGETVSENFKAIVTGYGIKEEHHKDHS